MRINRLSFYRNYWLFLLLMGIILFCPFFLKSYFLKRLALIVEIYVISVTGITLLTSYAGIVSLGHSAFLAIGAYTSAILTTKFGINPWFAMTVAACFTTICAYFFAVPFLKLRKIYLAMATLGLGEVTYLLALNWTSLTSGVAGIPGIPHLNIGQFEFKEEWKLFYLFGLFVILFTYFVDNIGRTRLGRAYHAIRTNEIAARAMGIDVQKELGRVFCLSSLACSLSGSLLAHLMTFISPESFTIDFSFALLIIVIIGGANIWGTLLTSVVLFGFSEAIRGFQDLSSGLYGLLLILALYFLPGGLATVFSAPEKEMRRMVEGCRDVGKIHSKRKNVTNGHQRAKILELESLTKFYGGTKALSEVSLGVEKNTVVSIIGPNGAGKTTLLNVVNGFLKPKAGKIRFKGQDITFLEPHEIASMGLGRTFQIVNLFMGRPVIENTMVGGHLRGSSGIFLSGLNLRRCREEEGEIMRLAMQSLELVGMEGKAYHRVEDLPFGEQRLVELARALTMEPELLLLDEPSAGLNPAETEKLSKILLELKRMGITVILVEHNMPLVMRISDTIHVLEFGELIASGTPSEIIQNEKVIRAYLGRDQKYAS